MDAQKFSENLINYLSNFIKNDDPNQGLSDQLDRWEKFTGENYLSFSNKDIVMSRGGLQSCKFWETLGTTSNKSSKSELSNLLLFLALKIYLAIL